MLCMVLPCARVESEWELYHNPAFTNHEGKSMLPNMDGIVYRRGNHDPAVTKRSSEGISLELWTKDVPGTRVVILPNSDKYPSEMGFS